MLEKLQKSTNGAAKILPQLLQKYSKEFCSGGVSAAGVSIPRTILAVIASLNTRKYLEKFGQVIQNFL